MGGQLPGILAAICRDKQEEAALLKQGGRERALRQAAEQAPPVRDLAAALRGHGRPAIIAELKRRSPSLGDIAPGADAAHTARAYQAAGAAAMSVLTDGPRFGGCLRDLARARAACGLPILRKDFILDPVQLYQSRAAGADAVLLIAEALPGRALAELFGLARELGLGVLLEVHGREQLERALQLQPELLGINNRDLATLAVDPEHCLALRPLVPFHVTVVAESGIEDPGQIARLAQAGLDAFLIGTGLMQSPDPAAELARLAGREAAR